MATNKHRGTCLINIGDKKRGLVFNMNTYAVFCEGMDIGLTEMEVVFNDKRQAKAFCWLLYAGCFAYDEKNRKDIDYDIHDFYDWAMDITQKDSEKVMETMLGSRDLGNDSNNGLSRNIVESNKDDLKKN
jgi:hypothetical protein